MTKARIAGGAAAIVFVVALVAGYVALDRNDDSGAGRPAAIAPATATAEESHPSFLYGRVTTLAGATYEGRLRTGDGEEAFWGDFFNGRKPENRWAAHVPLEQLPRVQERIGFLGVELWRKEREADLARPFMARFGDIARIEASATDVRVTLKSGTVVDLNRLDASDFDDGVRVWDAERGVVDLDSRLVRTVELLPAPGTGPVPHRLHGMVHTPQGDFAGFLQWNREKSLGSEILEGRDGDQERSLRFDTIRSIARDARDGSRVTLRDGREVVLSGTRDAGRGNRGIYVDDPRYGRVLISWDAFERVDFSADGSGPSYGDFPPGHPLNGSVTTRDGRRIAGRLVFDLDESETTETLDAPSGGVNYTIPFGLIASVIPHGPVEPGVATTTVTLQSGEELQLEPAGDLGDGNAGVLIFADGQERPVYVSWTDVNQIDFDRPPAIYPPLDAVPDESAPASSEHSGH